MSNPILPSEFDNESFNASLPKELRHAIFITARSMEDLAMQCNALVGRVYENEETFEGYFISGIKQVITAAVTEFHMDEESQHPKPVQMIHAMVLPEFEEIAAGE